MLCALSGGADSVYLLCALLENDIPVAAAHFNHGLRGGESDRDESFVKSFCAERGVPCIVGRGDVAAFAAEHGVGTEEAARELRYAFLEKTADELGASSIATAHTADDNAETVLLNLTRGAGARGLSGIPPRRGRIVRPVLDVTRAEIERYLSEKGIPHMEDSTNAEDLYARNRIRSKVVPVLRELNPEFSQNALRASMLLRADDDFLTETAQRFIDEHQEDGSLPADALRDLPRPISSRAVRLMAGNALSEEHVDAVLALCAKDRARGYADVPRMRVKREYGKLHFGAKTEASVKWPGEIRPGTAVVIEELGLRITGELMEAEKGIHSSVNTFFFKYENICGIITCAARKNGDAIRLSGRRCTKSLKKLFSEARVPLEERDRIPVFRDEKGPVAVYGFGAAERLDAAPGCKTFRISCEKII